MALCIRTGEHPGTEYPDELGIVHRRRRVAGADFESLHRPGRSVVDLQPVERLSAGAVVDDQVAIRHAGQEDVPGTDVTRKAHGIVAAVIGKRFRNPGPNPVGGRAVALVQDIDVVTQPAVQRIGSLAAGDGVVAIETIDEVAARPVVNPVGKAGADDVVVLFRAVEVEAAGEKFFPAQAATVGNWKLATEALARGSR